MMKRAEQQEIFDDWLAHHRGLLFKVVRAYANRPEEQDDLFQEIAIQLWRSIPQFRGKSKVATWIYRVAFYTASTWKRDDSKRRDGRETFEETRHVLIQNPHPTNRRLDWLFEQIHQFDEPDRSITLLMLESYMYQEIADVVGLSAGNVGVRINRIKKQLTENLKERQYDGL